MLLENASSDGKHSAIWQQLDENRYAVVTYSSKNDTFTNNDALLTFAIKGEGYININDILLVDEQRAPSFLSNTGIDVTFLGKDNVEPFLYDHQAADMNNSGGVDAYDVTELVNVILEKLTIDFEIT